MKRTRILSQKFGIGLSLIFLLTMLNVTSPQAEEKKLFFPKDAKEIEEFFLKNQKSQTKGLQPKGLQTKGIKGIGGIVKDERANTPTTAGALVLFDYNSATIKPESYEILKEFATALKGKLQGMKMTIAGHTDSQGSSDYNWGLSKRRAQAVKEFLVFHHNIDAYRLNIKPYGESKPIESNTTADGRAMNRRVEFSDAGQ